MAKNRTITSANASFRLNVSDLGLIIDLQGFAVDGFFEADAHDLAEVVIGVDGKVSAAYIPSLKTINVHLQADSVSQAQIDTWAGMSKAQQDVYYGDGIITEPGINTSYLIKKIVLQNWKPLADAGKTLKQRDFKLVCQDIIPIPI